MNKLCKNRGFRGRTLIYCLLFTVHCSLLTISCREDELTVPVEYDTLPIQPDLDGTLRGMYLLNEGNMGSNKASIDFVDFRSAVYIRNLYAERNPHVIMELGDVGNDIQVYGGKLYAVINCSHKVEVMDAYTCERIGQVDIPNCRYIRFDKGNAYVSSYVGPVTTDPSAQSGAVFRVDTASLEITGQVTVGYQPDELEIREGYLYVVNSGGYRAPDYDYTISVVDLDRMKQVEKIPVGINLNRIKKDKYGKLWVVSGGNHRDIPSKIYVLEADGKNQMQVTDTLDIPCSDMCMAGDSLYFYNSTSSQSEETVSYGIIDIRTKQLLSRNFITDGTETDIKLPFGIHVDPRNGDIYLTDAKNYVSSGMLYCYSREGKRKWSMKTGDIPAHMALLWE